MSKSALELLGDALLKDIGGSDELDVVKNYLDTGFPILNKIVSGKYRGGLPYGRIIEMFGPPSCGKTAISTNLMKETQKRGGIAIFMDHERSFELGMAENMGLVGSFPHFIYKKPQTWEESNSLALQYAEKIRASGAISEEAPILIVFDSVAAMVPQSSLAKGLDQMNMNDTTALARASSTTLKVMALKASELNTIILYLNQTRTAPGVTHGDPTTTPGGKSFEFFASVRLSLGRTKLVDKVSKEFVGQIISVKTAKNKIHRPFQKCELDFDFNEEGVGQFNYTATLISTLKALGKLEASGAYLVWDGKKYYATQLAAKIDAEGRYEELLNLLPPDEEEEVAA